MAYDDDWEREMLAEIHRWSSVRRARERREWGLSPDECLDEVGWEIFYCATLKGMDPDRAAAHAMDGLFRQRCRVRDDLWSRLAAAMRQRSRELRPSLAGEVPLLRPRLPNRSRSGSGASHARRTSTSSNRGMTGRSRSGFQTSQGGG